MAGSIADPSGEIIGLIELHDAYPEGFEASLIAYGLRYWDAGETGNDWNDINAVITSLPYDSPLARQQKPETWFWYAPWFDIFVGIYETLRVANMTRRLRKFRKSDLPKRIPRPWDVERTEKKLGTRKMPLDEMNKFLGLN